MYAIPLSYSRINSGKGFDISNYENCTVDKFIALELETSGLCLDMTFTRSDTMRKLFNVSDSPFIHL